MGQGFKNYDFVVLGAGIVGLACASALQKAFNNARVLLLDKESGPGQHQTGRNSGVIHAGIYYPPGSLKADFCKRGLVATKRFCDSQGIAYDPCGKLLVATDARELERMQALHGRALQNGLEVALLDETELRAREPNICGLGAIWVAATAVVDYGEICQRLLAQFKAAGGEFVACAEVVGMLETDHQVAITTASKRYQGQFVVAAAGLWADRVATMVNARLRDAGAAKKDSTTGSVNGFSILPFRGEYYRLDARHEGLINHLIYPIPDPELPFLGVHLTKMVGGGVTVGPNAVLGFKRDGYGRANFSPRDSLDLVRFAGLKPLLQRHWRSGWSELKDSVNKAGYLRRVQKYCPGLTLADLQPHPTGIRAQAVLSNGELVHDFLFAETRRSLHVCNAPSPAATSAFPISDYLIDQIAEKLKAL